MPTDPLDRDRVHPPSANAEDDEGELELEPIDPELIAAAERRAAEAVQVHRQAIDINEVYRDLDDNRDSVIIHEWLGHIRPGRFQFRIKHLLLLTAVIALILALRNLLHIGFGTLLIVGFMLTIFSISLLLKFEENKRQEAANRRRQKMYAARRAAQLRQAGQSVDDDAQDDEFIDDEPARRAAVPWRELRWQFSLSQLMVAMTICAMLFGVGSVTGGVAGAATICGLVALVGLAIPFAGFQPPQIVVFGWWLMLAMYVVLSIGMACWSALSN